MRRLWVVFRELNVGTRLRTLCGLYCLIMSVKWILRDNKKAFTQSVFDRVPRFYAVLWQIYFTYCVYHANRHLSNRTGEIDLIWCLKLLTFLPYFALADDLLLAHGSWGLSVDTLSVSANPLDGETEWAETGELSRGLTPMHSDLSLVEGFFWEM